MTWFHSSIGQKKKAKKNKIKQKKPKLILLLFKSTRYFSTFSKTNSPRTSFILIKRTSQ